MKVIGTDIDFAATVEDHFADEVKRLNFVPPPTSVEDLLERYKQVKKLTLIHGRKR